MSHLSHQSHLLSDPLAVIPTCILHSALCDSPPNSPSTHPSPRITYLLPLHSVSSIQPPTHPACHPFFRTHTHTHTHPHICKHTHAPAHTQAYYIHTYIHTHTLAHTPTLTPRPRPAIYGTAPTPQPAPATHSIAEVSSPPHPYAPHASSIIRRRRGHGSIAILTPRRQADNDER